MKLCECGCGQPAPIATRNDRAKGYVLGQPRRFIIGHNARRRWPGYREEDRGHETPCWIWLGRISSDGYARCGLVEGKEEALAHRVMFKRAGGVIPDGHELDHLCRVRECVRPSHLDPVTPAVNNRRRVVVRVNPDIVRAILAEPGGWGSGRRIAQKYGIPPAMVSSIRLGRSWNGVAPVRSFTGEVDARLLEWWAGMDGADLEPVAVPRQLLKNALAACRAWMALQRDVHPESIDGWGLEELLAISIGEASNQEGPA